MLAPQLLIKTEQNTQPHVGQGLLPYVAPASTLGRQAIFSMTAGLEAKKRGTIAATQTPKFTSPFFHCAFPKIQQGFD